jgi:uncharacterized protein (DUF58 family)
MRSALGCAALGMLLVLVAGTFDAEPLYVTGTALILLGAGAAAWIGLGARGVQVRRTLGARSVLEDEPLPVTIMVRAGRLPLPPGTVDEPLLGEPRRIAAGHRVARTRADVRFPRRGRRALAPTAVVFRDPFGLAERVVHGTDTHEVIVLPRTYPVLATGGGGDAGSLRSRAALAAAAETDIDGLQPHREGAPASRIHWASLARGAGLMERKMVAEADARPLVVLDPRGAAEPQDLDDAVRAAASLVLHFARKQGCGLLLPGDRRAIVIEPDLTGWPAAHARLAVVEDGAGPGFAAAQHRRGLVVLVSARRTDRPPRSLGRMPGGCLLVVPGELSGRRPVASVAGCHGYLGMRGNAGATLAAMSAAA